MSLRNNLKSLIMVLCLIFSFSSSAKAWNISIPIPHCNRVGENNNLLVCTIGSEE